MGNVKSSGRYDQLDSLRGIAALTVLINHFLLVFPSIWSNGLFNLLKYTPLRIVWAGHSAVMFFFILSGFVLALPFLKESNVHYLKFLIKRVCRIYTPYIVAIGTALLCFYFFSTAENDSAYSDWVAQTWVHPIDWKMVLQHILLIGYYKDYQFNPVIWSLIHEMRIALIFPLLILIVRRYNLVINAAVIVLLSAASVLLTRLFGDGPMYSSNMFITLHYIGIFMIGALLAKHRVYLVEKYLSIPKLLKAGLFAICVVIYSSSFAGTILDWTISLCGAFFIVIALSNGIFSKVLLTGPLKYLGKISFSLYLFHANILLSLVHLLHNSTALWLIELIALPIVFIVSTLSYRFVEDPSIRLGRILTSWGSGSRDARKDRKVTVQGKSV